MMWELVGAVVGAGLASGREIASFFAQYGYWGYAGILISGLTIGFLGTIQHPIQWRYRWMKGLWGCLLTAMLIVTGGAMLSGAGEIGAMFLPFRGASWIGQLLTLSLSWLLAQKSISGFAMLCKIMMIVLGAMIMAVLFSPVKNGCVVSLKPAPASLLSGMMYGGFNAALQVPILEGKHGSTGSGHHIWRACIVCCVLLALGTTIFLRQPLLLSEPMPFLAAVRSWGITGYWLFGISLYLAILSTLTACMKGLKGYFTVVSIFLVAQMGFTGVVEYLYPLLGTCCFAMLVCAKFLKSGSSPFHSMDDVI